MSEFLSQDPSECPTCRGRPWAVWGWDSDGWPVWCPCCGGRGVVPLLAEGEADQTRSLRSLPFVVTDDDEES